MITYTCLKHIILQRTFKRNKTQLPSHRVKFKNAFTLVAGHSVMVCTLLCPVYSSPNISPIVTVAIIK